MKLKMTIKFESILGTIHEVQVPEHVLKAGPVDQEGLACTIVERTGLMWKVLY